MIDTIKFPVITFAPKNVVSFSRNIDDLTTCSRRGLKNGYYNGLQIIDCSGNHYRVIDAQKIGTVGFFFGLNLIYGQKLRVKLNLEKIVNKISIDDFKAKIIKVLKQDRFFWNSGGDLDRNFKTIMESDDHYQIVKYLTENYFHDFSKPNSH